MIGKEFDIIVCKCGQKLKVPANAFGKAFKCVRCGSIVVYDESTLANVATTSTKPAELNPTTTTLTSSPDTFFDLPNFLISLGVVSQQDINDALKKQEREGGYLLKILYNEKKISSEFLFEVMRAKTSYPRIDLSRFFVDKQLLELIPRKICEDRFIFPVDKLGRNLTLAMACPADKETILIVEKTTDLRVKPMLAKIDEIKEALSRCFSDKTVTDTMFSQHQAVTETPKPVHTPKVSREYEEEGTLVKFPEEIQDTDKRLVEPILDSIEYLPIPSTAELALSMVLDDTEVDLEDISAIFCDDPSLTSALLRWANTALCSGERKIGSIWSAITLLGPQGIRTMMNHIKETNRTAEGFPVLPISGRAKLCAKVAEKLANISGKVNPSVAYTTALIHQIGAIVLYLTGQDEYKRVMRESLPENRLKKENQLFTLNHSIIASILASRWNYPEVIVQALCHYLEPTKATQKARDLAHIIHISSLAGITTETSIKDELYQHAIKAREKSIHALGLDVREVVMSLG